MRFVAVVRQSGCCGRQLVDSTGALKLACSVAVEENVMVSGRQRNHVDVRHERRCQDPQSSRLAVGSFDFLDQWLGKVRSHETCQIAVFAHRYVTTCLTIY